MALIAVMWIIAAMSLVVTGIVKSVKNEIASAGMHRQIMVGSALADGAILLALSLLHAQQTDEHSQLRRMPVQFAGETREVSIHPLNGLVDINNASVQLFADLYRFAGGLNVAAAQALAQSTVDTRQVKDARGNVEGFDASEDLLRVPGMTYDVYVMVADLVTADLREGSGRINPRAAPFAVLVVLTGGDVSRAKLTIARRETDPSGIDPTFFKQEHIEMSSSRSVRIQVPVNLPDGGILLRSWLILWSTDPRSGLPWRVLGRWQVVQRTVVSMAENFAGLSNV